MIGIGHACVLLVLGRVSLCVCACPFLLNQEPQSQNSLDESKGVWRRGGIERNL